MYGEVCFSETTAEQVKSLRCASLFVVLLSNAACFAFVAVPVAHSPNLFQMLPLLYEHFRLEGVTSEMFLMDWMMSLFTKVRAVTIVYCASYGAVSALCCVLGR
jgi:hypothetical protein